MRSLAFATAILLGACSASVTSTPVGTTISAGTTPTASSGLLTDIGNFTNADLTNAIGIATTAGPAGQPIVQCFTFLRSQLAVLQTQNSNTGTAIGVATAFTIADLALANVNSALSSAAQTGYYQACGPLVLSVQNQGLTLQAQIATLAALLAK